LNGKKIAVSLETHAPLIVKAMLHHDGGIVLSENDLRVCEILAQQSSRISRKAIPVLNNELTRHIYPATIKCYKDDTSLKLEEWERLATFANTNGLTGGSNKQINGRETLSSTVLLSEIFLFLYGYLVVAACKTDMGYQSNGNRCQIFQRMRGLVHTNFIQSCITTESSDVGEPLNIVKDIINLSIKNYDVVKFEHT
jgi:hypothetical protein